MRMWRNGRRAGFRFQCCKTCGFKSRHPHQNEKADLYGLLFVLAAGEDAEPTSRGCYSTKRYLKLNFKNTTSTQVTEASRIGFTKLAEPYLGYPLNISYSNQNSLGGDDNIPSFKSNGANGLRSTRI